MNANYDSVKQIDLSHSFGKQQVGISTPANLQRKRRLVND
jgi:hypothetical protein